MIEKLLKVKEWTSKTNYEFFDALIEYTDDEKCVIVADTAKELMNRGGYNNMNSAEIILIYATQHFFNVSDSNYKALVYYRLGEFYEKYKENYVRAYTYYEKYTLNNSENSGTHSLLLRALILRDDFTYSDELEKELRMSYGEIDLGLREDRLYENLGALIVARHEGGKDELCEKHIKRLKAIVKADEYMFLDVLVKKDDIRDVLEVPKKVTDYINKL